MSLDLSKLEMVRQLANGGIEARCPACVEGGHDRKGEHLLIKPDGRFGCCANPKDREHRKRIFALAGDTAPKSIKVKPEAVKIGAAAVISGVFGRLGRLFPSPAKPDQISDASDGVNEVQPDPALPQTPCSKWNETERGKIRTLRTPQYSYTCREKNREGYGCMKYKECQWGRPKRPNLSLGWTSIRASEASELGKRRNRRSNPPSIRAGCPI